MIINKIYQDMKDFIITVLAICFLGAFNVSAQSEKLIKAAEEGDAGSQFLY